MLTQFNINDAVLIFGEYKGIVMQQDGDQVLVYCPDFKADEPYLFTHVNNVVSLNWQERTNLVS